MVMYIIKPWYRKSGGGDKMINYSLQEQDTGMKWTDGKTIYQKTIQVPSGTYVSAGSNKAFSTSDAGFDFINNIETLVDGFAVGVTEFAEGLGFESILGGHVYIWTKYASGAIQPLKVVYSHDQVQVATNSIMKSITLMYTKKTD